MAERCKDLPDECWELIFNRLHQLHHSHLDSPSLSCKRFLSITNTLRTSLSIVDPTLVPLSTLFNRFPNLKSIHLNLIDDQDLNRVVTDIATSSLNIETLHFVSEFLPLESFKILGSRMKNLRVLKCSDLSTLRDADLVVIADSMPCLEELNIAYPDTEVFINPHGDPGEVGVTDRGIELLSSKLKGLRKIDISGNQFLTDKSLLALSTNCIHLSEIIVLNCSSVTSTGIEFVMRNSTKLSSLSLQDMDFGRLDDYSICCAKSISTLEIYNTVVPDEYLQLLAKTDIPLKRFTLHHCWSFTFPGISLLFNKFRSLECLSLTGIDFLTDGIMSDLSQCLSALVMITVNRCSNLTDSTFFSLAKNCPLLQDISMEGTNVGGGGRDRATNIVKNSRIKSLNLTLNKNLTDECLAKLASVCLNLEVLDVSQCKGITDNGIAYFLKSGSNIRKLQINHCGGIKNIGHGFELSEFEVLGAARSGINDDGLVVLGSRCRGLLNLNLDGCLGVTTVGLKEILANCERLRKINLTGCLNMGLDMVDWMLFSRPSLRTIILLYSFLPFERWRKSFLHRGCLVV